MRVVVLLLFSSLIATSVTAQTPAECRDGQWGIGGPAGVLQKFERLVDIDRPRDTQITRYGNGTISLFQLKITLADGSIETLNYPQTPPKIVRTLKRLDVWFQQTNLTGPHDQFNATICAEFRSGPQ